MGFTGPVSRSMLADANERRDWRIYADFAQALIAEARKLYATEPPEVELDRTVYALDSSTIDLTRSFFPWASFRETKAAVKLHTLLDLRGNIPVFSGSPAASRTTFACSTSSSPSRAPSMSSIGLTASTTYDRARSARYRWAA